MRLDILMSTDGRSLHAWLRLAWYDHLGRYSSVNRVLLGGRLRHHHVMLGTSCRTTDLWEWPSSWLRRRHKCHQTLLWRVVQGQRTRRVTHLHHIQTATLSLYMLVLLTQLINSCKQRKGKEEYLYSPILYTMYISKRSGIDHTVLPANTPCLTFLRKRSPDGATLKSGKRHSIAAYYSSIDPEGMKGWVGLVGWQRVHHLVHNCSQLSLAICPWVGTTTGQTATLQLGR